MYKNWNFTWTIQISSSVITYKSNFFLNFFLFFNLFQHCKLYCVLQKQNKNKIYTCKFFFCTMKERLLCRNVIKVQQVTLLPLNLTFFVHLFLSFFLLFQFNFSFWIVITFCEIFTIVVKYILPQSEIRTRKQNFSYLYLKPYFQLYTLKS